MEDISNNISYYTNENNLFNMSVNDFILDNSSNYNIFSILLPSLNREIYNEPQSQTQTQTQIEEINYNENYKESYNKIINELSNYRNSHPILFKLWSNYLNKKIIQIDKELYNLFKIFNYANNTIHNIQNGSNDLTEENIILLLIYSQYLSNNTI